MGMGIGRWIEKEDCVDTWLRLSFARRKQRMNRVCGSRCVSNNSLRQLTHEKKKAREEFPDLSKSRWKYRGHRLSRKAAHAELFDPN